MLYFHVNYFTAQITLIVCFPSNRLIKHDHMNLLDNGSRLKIFNVSARDNGVYSCKANNGEKEFLESTDNILVNSPVNLTFDLKQIAFDYFIFCLVK